MGLCHNDYGLYNKMIITMHLIFHLSIYFLRNWLVRKMAKTEEYIC